MQCRGWRGCSRLLARHCADMEELDHALWQTNAHITSPRLFRFQRRATQGVGLRSPPSSTSWENSPLHKRKGNWTSVSFIAAARAARVSATTAADLLYIGPSRYFFVMADKSKPDPQVLPAKEQALFRTVVVRDPRFESAHRSNLQTLSLCPPRPTRRATVAHCRIA